jgi:hypothetical protein
MITFKHIDDRFCLKIASFNSIGFLIAILTPYWVDPQLHSHVKSPGPSYPLAPWFLLLMPIVFLATLCLLKVGRCKHHRSLISWIPLLVAGVPSLWAFRPGFPHMGFMLLLFAFSLLSFLTVWLHFTPEDTSFLQRSEIPLEAKLEQLKASIFIWRSIFIYGAVGYLAFSISWVAWLTNATPIMLTDRYEQFFFNNVSVAGLLIFTVGIMIGPLNEAFMRTSELQKKFSTIRDESRSTNS